MKRRAKYGAVPTVVDGVRFASKREAARYRELRLLERAGEIARLELQPRYPLSVSGETIGSYVADFRYVRAGVEVVEDVKGVKTPMYRWKKKHLRAEYGVEIEEVR